MRVGTAVLLSIVLTALAAPALAAPARTEAPDPVLWPEEQRAFFQDGPGLLLTDAQHFRFLWWKGERGRGDFVREFLDHDPIPETPENELTLGIERRQRLALLSFPSPLDVRSQLLFLRGEPAVRRAVDCRVLKPLEIWKYATGERPLVVFRTQLNGPWQLWLPQDGRDFLYYYYVPSRNRDQREALEAYARATCPAFAEVERATATEEGREGELAGGWLGRAAPEDRVRALFGPRGPSGLMEWAREAAAKPGPPLPERLEAGPVEVDFPRRVPEPKKLEPRMAVRALLPVVPGGPGARLTLSAVLEHRGTVIDELHVLYRLPRASAGRGAPVSLLFESSAPRELTLLLRLRLRDEVSGAEAQVTRGFVVPNLLKPGEETDEMRTSLVGEPLDLGDRLGPDSLLLPPPPDQPVTSVWRAEPLVMGDRIDQVVFLVDGEVQATLSRRPFAAELRLSPVPREQVVRAVGYDQNDLPVAADEVVVHTPRSGSGGRPFQVKLAAPGSTSEDHVVVARAEVEVPEGRQVKAVEIRLNDVPVATLAAPPWEARVDVPAKEPIVYLSAVARLDDGSQAEAVRFLRAPENLERINVRLVELYATVTSRSGRLVRNLAADDFEVREDGRPQTLTRFELVQNLPLNLGLVIDTSTSMISSIAETQRAASSFLRRLLRPRDRWFAVGIADRPYLLLPVNGDPGMILPDTRQLRPEGRTSLYDSIASALIHFREGRGQRALVLLSDGVDTVSYASFRQAVDLARRSGVTLYTIGLGLSVVDEKRMGPNRGHDIYHPSEIATAREVLAQIASETGGRTFLISRAEELDAVYDLIGADLRSRYLLAYQTERGEEEEDFRPVEVRVKKWGLRVRTAWRYSP